MTESDRPKFTEWFDMLAVTFQLRVTAAERVAMARAYFKIFEHLPAAVVRRGYETCLQRADRFPKPSQWLAAMPIQGRTDVPALTVSEIIEREAARQTAYERPACHCQECVAASVDEKPLQYLPIAESGDPAGMARDLRTGVMAWRGAWLHGHALARWYAARATFWDEFWQLLKRPAPEEAQRSRGARRRNLRGHNLA